MLPCSAASFGVQTMKIRPPTVTTLLALFWLSFGLVACASSSGTGGAGFGVEVRAVALDPAEVAGSAEALFLGGFVLDSSRNEFGGFSGLLIDDLELVAISDRGFWWQQPLKQQKNGRIELASGGQMGPLFDFGGRIPDGGDRRDAEEIATWPGGQLVSYEGEHRIVLYRRASGRRRGDVPPIAGRRPRRLKVPVEIDVTIENGGIEAMTRLRDGRLVIFSEEQHDRQGRGLLWVGEPTRGRWRLLKLELVEDFLPTSAATLPSGDVLVLERSYEESRGVRARIRRIPVEAFAAIPSGPRAPIVGSEILRIEPPEAVDNFEGLEVLAMEDGRVFFFLLSDDNFNDSQRTLLLQFELLPG